VKRIVWTDPARSDIRAISNPVAMQILSALHRLAESGVGDIKTLRDVRNYACASATTACFSSARIPIRSRFGACYIVARPTDSLDAHQPSHHRVVVVLNSNDMI